MTGSNIEWLLNQDEIQTLELKDLEELLNNIDSLGDFDFAKLDSDDSSLSETELKLKQRLEEIEWKSEFIKSLIEQLKLLKWVEKNNALISKLNVEDFINNHEYIILIEDAELLKKVLENSDKKIELEKINKNLIWDFILHPKIEITFVWLSNIDKKIFEEKFEKIIIKDKLNLASWILLKAVSFWINKEKIKEIIEKYRINKNDLFEDINIYIWNYEKIELDTFEKLRKKYNNFDNLEKNPILEEDLKIITNYLIQVQETHEDLIIRLINNWEYWNNNEFLFLAKPSKKILIAIIKESPWNISYIPNNYLWNIDIINTFLNEEWRLTNLKYSLDEKIPLLKFLDLSNINNFLHIFKFYIDNWKKLNDLVIENPHFLTYIKANIVNISDIDMKVDLKYFEIIHDIKDSYYSTLDIMFKSKLVSAKNSNQKLNWNENLEKHIINEFNFWLEKNLVWKLSPDNIKKIIDLIENSWKIDNDTIKKITKEVINFEWLNEEEKKEIFKILINHFKDFKKSEIEKLKSEIDLIKISKEFLKDVDWKKELDENSIFSKCKEFIESKKYELEWLKWKEREQKIDDLINEFITNYFKESSPKDKETIFNIIKISWEIEVLETIEKNIPAYFDYVKSWSELSFEDYAKENKIELNQSPISKNNENNNIIENKNYTYNSETWEIIPNWEQKLNLTSEEKKLARNEKYRENLVNFYSFFKDLNLIWVWNFRHNLVNVIWNVNIDLTDDSLSKSELLNFWNKLINFINNTWDVKLNNNNKSINSLNSELLKYTNAWTSLSDSKTYNLKWEDRFTAKLRELWIIWGAYFHFNNFKNLLNNKKES